MCFSQIAQKHTQIATKCMHVCLAVKQLFQSKNSLNHSEYTVSSAANWYLAVKIRDTLDEICQYRRFSMEQRMLRS